MESAKSRQHREKRKTSYRVRNHKNQKFYNGKSHKETKASYIVNYQNKVFNEIPQGKWLGMDLRDDQISYILSLGFTLCEQCLKLYCADARVKINKGFILDHIDPVNPNDALNTLNGIYGDPFDFSNLQILCRVCDNKKQQGRDKAFHKKIEINNKS